MNIKRAKQEIKDTIEAYLLKDERGEYCIPSVRQRPVLLIGPPGIGKHRLWSRLPENVRLIWCPIPLPIIQGKALWDCPLFEKKNTGEKSVR